MLRFTRLILALLVGTLVSGCKKETSAEPERIATPRPKAETVANAHWIGKGHLLNTNGLSDFSVWNLPQTSNLVAQTIVKLANAPQRVAPDAHSSSNTIPSLLVPLWEDVLEQESYVEVRQFTNQSGSLLLAVRAGESRLDLWSSNLLTVAVSWTKETPIQHSAGNGWGTSSSNTPGFSFRSLKDWAVFELSFSTNKFIDDFLQNLPSSKAMPLVSSTNEILTIQVDPSRVCEALQMKTQAFLEWPEIQVALSTNPGSIRSAATLKFHKALPQLTAWRMPTNLIYDPLISFTAVRGVEPLVVSLADKAGLELPSYPDQLFFWAQGGLPFFSYAAAPSSDAAGTIQRLGQVLMTRANPWMTNHGMGTFEFGTNANSVIWSNVIIVTPFLERKALAAEDYLFAGLVGMASTNRPMPLELRNQILGTTNLVYYDWEMTGPRLGHWLNFSQLAKFALGLAQIPPESIGFKWLKSLEDHLGNTATAVTRSDDFTLSLVRNSGIGLSAAELVFLCDWLEGPGFPQGLITFDGQPETRPAKRQGKR